MGVVPIKVEFDAADVGGATPTLVQSMSMSYQQQQQQQQQLGLGGVSNFNVVGSLGSLGGNIYVTSGNNGMQTTPTQQLVPATVTTNAIQSVATTPDPSGAESAVSNRPTPTPPPPPPALQHVYIANPDQQQQQDPQLVPPATFLPPSMTTDPAPSGSSIQGPSGGTVVPEGGVLPAATVTKRRGRRKKSPAPSSDVPVKRRRGRPKGSGVYGNVGRRPGRRARVPSHTRYPNILPRPNMVGKDSSLPGVSSEDGTVAGISHRHILPDGATGDLGGVVSVVDAGQELDVVDVVGGVPSSKDVAVAAANCSAALSLGTRKVRKCSMLCF